MDNLNKNDVNSVRSWLGSGSINMFGRPFSGKDTQSKRLATLFEASLIGGGDIVRANLTTQEVVETNNQGKLIPQAAFLELVLPHFQKPEFESHPLILNSIGRWHGEEESVMKACESSQHPLKAVIHLDIPEQVAFDRFDASRLRLDRGTRTDDQKAVLKTRLDEFKHKTQPVLNFYKDRGLLITIDGTAHEDKVTANILEALKRLAR